MDKTPTKIKFAFDTEKAKQVILWILCRNNGSMDKLQLVKLIFFADREHLIKYGRPIVGGSYFAMDHGPVSSELLTLINNSQKKPAAYPFEFRGTFELIAKGSPDDEWLSESDLLVLDEIYQKYGRTDKWKLRDMTHKLKAYKKNEPPRGCSNVMSYEDFFEDLDEQ
jgi:uncharacterized phage-associated protein